MFSSCYITTVTAGGLLIAVLSVQLVLLFFIAWQFARAVQALRIFRHYIRQARRLAISTLRNISKADSEMDCDELIDGLLQEEQRPLDAGTAGAPPTADRPGLLQKHRERLAALVAGGQAKQYGLVVHGKACGEATGTATVDQIDALDDAEIEKLYARYEARLGAAMTKTLGSAALQFYARAASMFLPIPAENQPGLIADLEGDPFVGHALSSATCELYHRYGMFLAPLTAALTTMKHCQFGHQCPATINNDGEDGEPRDVAVGTTQHSVNRGDVAKQHTKC